MRKKKELEDFISFLEEEYRKLNISEKTFKKALEAGIKLLRSGKNGRRE